MHDHPEVTMMTHETTPLGHADEQRAREMLDEVSDALEIESGSGFKGTTWEASLKHYQRHVFPRAGTANGVLRMETFNALAVDYTYLILKRLVARGKR